MTVTTPDPRPKPPNTKLGQHKQNAAFAHDLLPTNEFDASHKIIAYGKYRCDCCKKLVWLECYEVWGWSYSCYECGYISPNSDDAFTLFEDLPPPPAARRQRKPRTQNNTTIQQLLPFTYD